DSGKEFHQIQVSVPPVPFFGSISAMAISPDGATLAVSTWTVSAKAAKVSLLQVSTGQELLQFSVAPELAGPSWCLRYLAFSPDGRTLIASGPAHIKVLCWDVANGNALSGFGPHEGEPHMAVFSSDGRVLATATYRGSIYFWETATGKSRLTLKGIGNTSS